MYKLFLCLRYLRTRYIALASIISVMLGVATMIVVNSVMAGFSSEMRDRLHGILSDIVIESRDLNGYPDADARMQEIRSVVGDAVEAMTPTVAMPALLQFRVRGEMITRQVNLIGIDEKTQGRVSEFCKYLQHPKNRDPRQMSFELREDGYDTRDPQAAANVLAPERPEMKHAGRERRREILGRSFPPEAPLPPASATAAKSESSTASDGKAPEGVPDPFASLQRERGKAAPAAPADPANQQLPGLIMGIGLAAYRNNNGREGFLLLPGDDVQIGYYTAGPRPEIHPCSFTVVDFYECKMSEYDSSFVFVPIRKLQEIRGMLDRNTGIGRFNSIQIKLKPGFNEVEVRDRLLNAQVLPAHLFSIHTWQEKQGPLLSAVEMEITLLNILLFLIIAVSGFGILAIFFMIVVEKTRDIGILKSLGASNNDIMKIFVSYGLSLGLVGSGVGLALGVAMSRNINVIADFVGKMTGRPVFDPAIYYFYRIPAIINPWTVTWIVSGAIGIAVLASILPAIRAALLHPVEALRYE